MIVKGACFESSKGGGGAQESADPGEGRLETLEMKKIQDLK